MDPSFIPAMASSSTSSIQSTSFKYDVFLSFRGEDTRTSFVDHLYHALKLENIETYKDDENLERGKKIGKELIEAIEDSRFHVIVFSKNYASSSWCLDELVKIIECQETPTEHTVYPIFYDVEPTHVRKQSGEFGKAFSKHENDEDAEKWRKALVEATSFSGQDLTVDKYEVEFIKKVVKEISLKLPSISVDESLIGIRTRIDGVVSSLNAFPNELCMIGIWGMGGSGKTTLARAVFDQICTKFEGSSFVENVRERSNSLLLGLNSLQQQVLGDVFKKQDIFVNGVLEGKKEMKKKMHGIKVLVVLDDIDHIDQLKALAGERNWFKKGSVIIITTRDKQVLLAHKVVNSIQDVNLLTDEEAICLLSRCAFGNEIPSPRYEELSRQVVSYAAGLPLTITILGSSLYGENECVWIDTLKELEKIPLDGTLQRLELSYKGLDTNCQEIFLDIACMLKGWKEDETIKVLESRGFHAIRGLSVLEKKSLITISRDRCLYMHDHIQEMGRHIVRRSDLDEPRRHSRLWIEEEIVEILAKDLGTEATCIYLDLFAQINQETVMKGFGNMKKLRFLLVKNFGRFSNWEFDEVSRDFPNSLQYLKWTDYPFRFLPKTFQASNLVALELRLSKMKQLWEGGEKKVLHKLRFLDLSYSFHLETLDLKLAPNIDKLKLEGCGNLLELYLPRECPQLKYLILGCENLRSLNLSDLILSKLEYLKLIDSKLKTLKLTQNLHSLFLEGCDLVELHIPDGKLKSLDIQRCSELKTLDIARTQNLEILRLQDCYNLVKLYAPIGGLEKLILLKFEGNLRFRKFEILDIGQSPELRLSAMELTSRCPLHPDNKKFPKFRVDCSYKEDLPSSIGNIEKLISVGFSCVCTDLQSFFGSICGLQHLTKLSLEHDIPEAPKDLDRLQCLEELRLSHTRIEHLPDSICMLKHLKILTLDSCFSYKKLPEDLGRLECLEKLTLSFAEIKHLPDSISMLKHLKVLELRCCKLLEKLPEDVDRLECLENLMLEECKLLQDIPNNICRMKRLKHISLYKCIGVKKLPEELGCLECLEKLDITGTCITHLPQSILSMEKGLEIIGSRELLKSCGLTSEIQTSKGITFRHRDDEPQKAKQVNSQSFNRFSCVRNPQRQFKSSTDSFPEYFEGPSVSKVHDLFAQPKNQFTKNYHKRR